MESDVCVGVLVKLARLCIIRVTYIFYPYTNFEAEIKNILRRLVANLYI